MGDPATFPWGPTLGGNHLTDHRRGIRHWITSFLRREDRASPCPAAGIGPPLPFPGPDHRHMPALGSVWTPTGNHVRRLPPPCAPVHIRTGSALAYLARCAHATRCGNARDPPFPAPERAGGDR